MLVGKARTGDQGGHLLLFGDFPADEAFDIGMIDVDHHHLGGATGGAARLDGSGGAVADLQEAHQARGLAAARQLFALAPQVGEVGAGAGAIFEETGFADPQVHDAAFIDQIVADGLDEAGMGLGMLVGAVRLGQLAGLIVHIEVTLAGAVDAIGPMQAGVEPLRAVGSPHLLAQHIAHFVIEGLGVILGVEIAALPAPIGPGSGQTVENLLGGMFAGSLGVSILLLAPQPFGHTFFAHGLQGLGFGHAGAAEILLSQDVAGHLGPFGRHLDITLGEDHRSIGIADFRGGVLKADALVGGLTGGRKVTLDAHEILTPDMI